MTAGANFEAERLRTYGHYRVLSRPDGTPWLLGAGGMGMTYRAVDTRLQVEVALKVIHPSRVADPDAQRLFLREARAAARVMHPNVSPVLFLNDEPGRIFYAMEFVDGDSLFAWLRDHGPPPPAQALAFAEQIAAGLAAIHAQHLVHRDLKPGNIMVTHYPATDPRARTLGPSGGCALKIIDFGLARGTGGALLNAHAPDPTLGFRGTVTYASPEQCEEQSDLDGRSDLYALGCILWEMLSGLPPFIGETHRELLNQQVHSLPPWKKLPALPEEVLGILRRLLAKDRADRFADAAQVLEALAEARPLCQGLTAQGSSTRTAAATKSRFSLSVAAARHRLRVRLAVGAVLLAGACAVGWITWQNLPPRRPEAARPLRDAVQTSELDASEAARRRFIAVLPFASRGSESNDFFTEGIHEDVLASLSKVRDLRVISRSSVSKYRDDGSGIDVRRIGRELGVGTILQGSVRRQGGRVRVTTQLVDTRTDEQLWSESYDREITDVFEIQTAVAREITTALAANFSAREATAVARRPTRNAAAYELFVQARSRHSRSTVTREWLDPVVDLYERATQLDPEFALAYAMLARVHSEIYWFAVDSSPERIERARAAAQKAIKLQPELPEAHVALGEILYRVERNYEAALGEYRTALAIAPSNPFALEASALALRRLNRWEEALANFRRSAELSPDDGQKYMALAEMLFVMRRFDEAEASYRRCVRLSGNREWEFNLELCRLEKHGDWAEFARAAVAIIEHFGRDAKFTVQVMLRDFQAALVTLRGSKEGDLRDVIIPVPRALFAGRVLRSLGNLTEAADEFTTAAEILRTRVAAQPDNGVLRMKYAMALAGMHDRDGAIREGEAALRSLPESRDAVLARAIEHEFAQVCAEVGEPERACELLERLLTVEIKLTRTHLRYFPEYDALRGYPRFERILSAK